MLISPVSGCALHQLKQSHLQVESNLPVRSFGAHHDPFVVHMLGFRITIDNPGFSTDSWSRLSALSFARILTGSDDIGTANEKAESQSKIYGVQGLGLPALLQYTAFDVERCDTSDHCFNSFLL